MGLFGAGAIVAVIRLAFWDNWVELPEATDDAYPTEVVSHAPIAVLLVGALRVRALRWSLATVARRHAVLRTVFQDSPAGPVQAVAEAHGGCAAVESVPGAGTRFTVELPAG